MAEIKLSRRSHPLYDSNIAKWLLYINAVKGGKDFITEANLFEHRLEDTEDYEERLERAYYLNFCEVIPKIYNTYIFKERIERPADSNLDYFRSNADRRGTSINDFVKKVGFLSSVFGTMHVLVDVPLPSKAGKKGLTKAQEKEQGIEPFCSLVYPYQIKDWSFDDNGNLRWIVIESKYYRDMDPTKKREEETHYKLITTEEWRVEDKDGNKVVYEDGSPSSGKNTIGIVPLVTLMHSDVDNDLVGESMLKDIVYVNRTIFNWCSCLDEQIERNTFSQLTVPDDGTLADKAELGGDDPLRSIGTTTAWTFPKDSTHPPAFISPNAGNLAVIWDLVIDHIKEIFRLAGLIGSSNDMYIGRSGRAAQMGFLGVNANLADKAKSYQRFENNIYKLVYLFKNLDYTSLESVKYPESFDVTSLSDEIETIFNILERNISITLNKELMKNVARKSVPLAPDSIKSQIDSEIESGPGTIDKATTPSKKILDEGGTNKDDMSDQFVSAKSQKDKLTKKEKVKVDEE